MRQKQPFGLTINRIGEVVPNWKSIPYGKPIQNAKYFILDPNRQLCPIGVTGELHIGGDCLAEGYTDAEKNATSIHFAYSGI